MNLNICMIAYTRYPSDARVRREAETLAAHGNNVLFLIPGGSNTPGEYELNGVRVKELRCRKYDGKNLPVHLLSYARFTLLAAVECTRMFLRKRVDIVHVHNMPDILVLSGIVPRLFGKKMILDIHDTMPEVFESKFKYKNKIVPAVLRLEEALCCSIANALVCVNHVQAETIIRRGIPGEKIHILLNVPDHKIFPSFPEKTKKSHDGNGFKMVYHGTMADRLGIDLAVQAVGKLLSDIPDVELHFIGSGNEELKYIELSERMGLDRRVHFSRKSYPIEEIPDLIGNMNLGLIPYRNNSSTEVALPVKMIEYIALGIPTVVPRLRAIEYYFTDDMVAYYEPENVDSMADAILSLYRDEGKRKKQAESAMAFLRKYGWESHQNDLLDLYRKLSG